MMQNGSSSDQGGIDGQARAERIAEILRGDGRVDSIVPTSERNVLSTGSKDRSYGATGVSSTPSYRIETRSRPERRRLRRLSAGSMTLYAVSKSLTSRSRSRTFRWVSKALRFGLDEVQPVSTGGDGIRDNRKRIREEYIDLVAMMEMLDVVPPCTDEKDRKKAKVMRFLAYSAECGTLSEALASVSLPPDCAHTFASVEMCSKCWRTEADITNTYHHCDEPQPSGRCWWCGRAQAGGVSCSTDRGTSA